MTFFSNFFYLSQITHKSVFRMLIISVYAFEIYLIAFYFKIGCFFLLISVCKNVFADYVKKPYDFFFLFSEITYTLEIYIDIYSCLHFNDNPLWTKLGVLHFFNWTAKLFEFSFALFSKICKYLNNLASYFHVI